MIFIGYSSKDRYTIVESMVFHLKNYGLMCGMIFMICISVMLDLRQFRTWYKR